MAQIGVTVFVSYPFINLKTGKVVFSTPNKLNFISNVQPYSVKGNIDGISPDVGNATKGWRINQKADIDDGDK